MSDGLFLSGTVLVEELNDDGTSKNEGLFEFGNTKKFELNYGGAETKHRKSTDEKNYGANLGTVVIPGNPEITIGGDTFNRDTVRATFRGDDQTIDIAAGNVANSTINMHLNRWTLLGHKFVDEVAITGLAASDFNVDKLNGKVMALTPAGAGQHQIGYSYAAQKGFIAKGGTRTIRASVVLQGKNMENGKRCEIKLADVTLVPEGATDFMAGDFSGLEFKSALQIPVGGGEPYSYTELEEVTA